MKSLTQEENNLLKWLVVIMATALLGLVIFLYQDLRAADQEQRDHRGEDIDKFREVNNQLITLNANVTRICEALEINCIPISEPGVTLATYENKNISK